MSSESDDVEWVGDDVDLLEPFGEDDRYLAVYRGLSPEDLHELEDLGWDMALPPKAEPIQDAPELEFINHEERPEVTINEDAKEEAYWVVEGTAVYPLGMWL